LLLATNRFWRDGCRLAIFVIVFSLLRLLLLGDYGVLATVGLGTIVERRTLASSGFHNGIFFVASVEATDDERKTTILSTRQCSIHTFLLRELGARRAVEIAVFMRAGKPPGVLSSLSRQFQKSAKK